MVSDSSPGALAPLFALPSSRQTVVLARHGQTALNAGGVLRGHLDPELDDQGRAEVARLARAVADLLSPRRPGRILTSPLRRAVQTAQAVGAPWHTDIIPTVGLIDRDYGSWAGHPREELVARFGSVEAAEGVEPWSAVARRARAVLDAQSGATPGGIIVMVGHDAVNRALLADIDPRLGDPDTIGQRTACWNLLVLDNTGWHVVDVDQRPDTPEVSQAAASR